jgi:hypothetical protein
MMKRWIWPITIQLALLSTSGGLALAGGTKVGARDGFDCTIEQEPPPGDPNLWVASGALGTVRSEPASDRTKWIGCYVDSVPGHSMVLCQAASEDGNQLMCASDDKAMVATVASMNADSFITFKATVPPPGSPPSPCAHISVENNSKYNVKSP